MLNAASMVMEFLTYGVLIIPHFTVWLNSRRCTSKETISEHVLSIEYHVTTRTGLGVLYFSLCAYIDSRTRDFRAGKLCVDMIYY